MTKKLFFTTLGILFIPFLLAAEIPTFYNVVMQKKVSFTATAKGGFQGDVLEIQLQNLLSTPLKFTIEAGTRFESEEDWTQDLMVVKELVVSMSPKEKSSVVVYTVCIEANNASPRIGQKFSLIPKAAGELLALAQIASEKKYYASSTFQSAVWTITDQAPISNVYGTDSAMLAAIIPPICSFRGVRPSDFSFSSRTHRLSSISTSLECLLPDYLANASLRVYDQHGRLHKTLWEEKTLVPGFYQFKVGIYHHEDDSATFQLRLENANQVVATKTVTSRDTIIPVRRLNKETTVTYELPQDAVARVAVYDSADNLYALIADNFLLKKGFNKTILQGTRELPVGLSYYLKITDSKNGNVLVYKKILLDKDEQKRHPLVTKRGTFHVKLEQSVSNAKLAIYDHENRVVWVVFENSQLSYGSKSYNYVFQHDAGDKAYFVARLTDGTGKVIAEKCVQGCL